MGKSIVGPHGSTRIPLRAFKDLPKRHREFIKAYVRTGDVVASYVKVGYKNNPRSAHQLHKSLNTYIAAELNNYVKGTELGIKGLALVAEIAEHSTNDMVRLNAAKELLSRSLPEDPKEVHHVHQKAELTDEQLLGRIKELRDKLAAPVPLNVVSLNE